MGLESQVLNKSRKKVKGTTIDDWIKEWKQSREVAKENILLTLASMYETYKRIKAGEKPKLDANIVELYGVALQQFRESYQFCHIIIKHSDILLFLEEAYKNVEIYVAGKFKN